MDDVAVALAALECGHGLLLCDPAALARRAREIGARLDGALDGSSLLVLGDDGAPPADLVAGPITLGEHALCTLGLLLGELRWGGERPLAGFGPVAVTRLSERLEANGRDGGPALVWTLRLLDRLGFVEVDLGAAAVRVGRALSAQPPAFFARLATQFEREEGLGDA